MIPTREALVGVAGLGLIGALWVGSSGLDRWAAVAQQDCVLREKAVPRLQKEFEEQIVGRGLTPNGKVMFELFVSQSGTWTVLVSDTDGRSCIVASGASWQRVPLVLGDPA